MYDSVPIFLSVRFIKVLGVLVDLSMCQARDTGGDAKRVQLKANS